MTEALLNRAMEIESSLNLVETLKTIRPKQTAFDVSHSIVVYPLKNQMIDVRHDEIFNKQIEEVSLYFHFPFCTGKCKYCHYISFPKMKDESVERYLGLLKKEIKLVKATGQLDNARISNVFIGGGTPTCIKNRYMKDVLGHIFSNFDISDDAEKTIEASPETIDAEKAALIKELGINRVSIGFQDFNDSVLKDIGRRHDSQKAKESYKIMKDVGIECVNIDLMIGLPDQNIDSVYGILKGITEVAPNSVTIYNMRLKPFVPMYRTLINEHHRFPGDKELLRMRIMLQEGLKDMGYKQELARWFVRDCKFKPRYQQQKWDETADVLGFGISAYSFINNCQYINHDTMSFYEREINASRLPIERGKCLSREESMQRTMIFGLRAGLKKGRFRDRYSVMPEEVFGDELRLLEDLGLIKTTESEITLTYKGALLDEEVCKRFADENVGNWQGI